MMQANEMSNQPTDFAPTVNQTVEPLAEKHYVTFTPEQWNYFAEELKELEPFVAFRRAKYLDKVTDPPRKFDTPQYPFVPYGDKSPGIDDVDLTPEEWNIFVEEVRTKEPYKAFNNAKYVVEIKSRVDSFKGNLKNSERSYAERNGAFDAQKF